MYTGEKSILNTHNLYLISWGADVNEGKLPLYNKKYVFIAMDLDADKIINKFYSSNNIAKTDYIQGVPTAPINNRRAQKIQSDLATLEEIKKAQLLF